MMRTSLPALLAVVLVACGGSGEPAESPAAAPAADAPASETPAPAAAPAAGKTDEAGWEGEAEAKKPDAKK